MPHIFCDLDGVLADFERGFELAYGFRHDSVPESAMWKAIMRNDKHWHELPLMPGAMDLWAHISPHIPTILTGCPNSGRKLAATGKRVWVARELGEAVPVITCASKDKQLHMHAPGDILIDDMRKNCKRWEEAGGVAVHHKDVPSTILALKAMGL